MKHLFKFKIILLVILSFLFIRHMKYIYSQIILLNKLDMKANMEVESGE
jgi:hypothetical protein